MRLSNQMRNRAIVTEPDFADVVNDLMHTTFDRELFQKLSKQRRVKVISIGILHDVVSDFSIRWSVSSEVFRYSIVKDCTVQESRGLQILAHAWNCEASGVKRLVPAQAF